MSFGAATLLQSLWSGSSVSLEPAALSWLSQLHWKPESRAWAELPTRTAGVALPEARPSRSPDPAKPKVRVRAATLKASHPAQTKIQTLRGEATHAADSKPELSVPTASAVQAKTTAEEAQTLVAVYQTLRHQFRMAMLEGPTAPGKATALAIQTDQKARPSLSASVNTQKVSSQRSAGSEPASKSVATATFAALGTRARPKIAVRPLRQGVVSAGPTAAAASRTETTQPVQQARSVEPGTQPPVPSAQAALGPSMVGASGQALAKAAYSPANPPIVAPATRIEPSSIPSKSSAADEVPSAAVAGARPATNPGAAAPVPAKAAPTLLELLAKLEPKATQSIAMNTQGQGSARPEVARVDSQSAPEMSAEVTDRAEYSMAASRADATPSAQASAAAVNTQAPGFRLVGVDLFGARGEISVRSEFVSYEGPTHASQSQWLRAKAQSTWPTVALLAPAREAISVPVLSQNAALILAAAQGFKIQSTAAIVFGRVGSGDSVRLSGRAERPIYFEQPDGSRIFLLANVQPGPHLLYVGSGGAVGAPSFEGEATYLDLRRAQEVKVSGRLLDASARRAEGVLGASIRVLGQPAQRATTDGRGQFTLEAVRTFGEHPVYLEAQGKTDFTHRYRISGPRTQGLALFRFPSATVDGWLRQLEGGVSAESGLVVGAFPALLAGAGQKPLFASLKPLQGNGGIVPETYSLQAADQLGVGTPLDPRSPRLLAVQVPEGLNLCRIQDRDRHSVWSELVVASPGVINVLGPY